MASGVMLIVTTLPFMRKPGQQLPALHDVGFRAGLALAVAMLLMVATFVPSHFLASLPTIERGLVYGVFTMILAAMYLGYLGGLVLAAWLAQRAALPAYALPGLALALVAILAALTLPPTLSEARRYDQLADYVAGWATRDRMLETAAGRQDAPRTADVIVAQLERNDRLEMTSTAHENVCAATYYGVRSIVAVP
jgi:MFS family permease